MTSEPIIIALIGVAGAVIGSVATVAVTWLRHYLQAKSDSKRDQPRKDLLLKMLNHKEHTWRSLDKLMHVIGTDETTTKRLLLEIGARASEDGQQLWGLTERNPLPDSR